MNIWKIDESTQQKIKSMRKVMDKIKEWQAAYPINSKFEIFSALTIMQPFAEGIIRKIKDIENRGSRIFTLSENDGEFEGCRSCIKEFDFSSFDYEAYGRQFVTDLYHRKLSKYCADSDFKYHKTASLVKCGCKYKRKRKRAAAKAAKTKANKPKPLPNYNAMGKRRKPRRNRRSNGDDRGAKYNYFGEGSDEKKERLNKLLAMGYSPDRARIASAKSDVPEAVEYLTKIQRVQSTKGERLGYSESLGKNNRKRKIETSVFEQKEQRRKRRKIMNDLDEKAAIDEAIKNSLDEQLSCRKAGSYDLGRKRVVANGRNKKEVVDLTEDENEIGDCRRRSVEYMFQKKKRMFVICYAHTGEIAKIETKERKRRSGL